LELPREIIWEIANHLGPRNIKGVADTCRSLRYTLADEKRSAMLTARAHEINTPSEARNLLNEIQTGISRPHLRAEPLAVLAMTMDPTGFVWTSDEQQRRIENWPADARVELFDSMWTAIMQVPHNDRLTPLVLLLSILAHLPASERTARYQMMLDQIAPLSPQDQATSLQEFAIQLNFLDTAGQQTLFSAFIEQARQLPDAYRAEALEALARHIPRLPEPAARFDTLLEETRQLPAPHVGFTLRTLAWALSSLPAAAQPVAFEAAIREVERIEPEQRTESVMKFIWQVRRLAQPARAAAFDHVFRAASRLHKPEDRAEQLANLAEQIAQLPNAALAERVDLVRNAIGQLPQDLQERPLATLFYALWHRATLD
jgi:hypothetical protein